MKILFMCADNSVLSQLAEGLARHILSDEAHIASAGFQPDKLNTLAAEALRDLGIDTLPLHAKRVDELPAAFMHELDFVITLCEGDMSSRLLAHAKHFHWPFPDCRQGQREQFQTALTHLRTQIEEFGREYDILRPLPNSVIPISQQPGL